jgi:hypothetical protein
MPSSTEPSVDELREESERAREALAATVGELRDKVGDTATELKTLVSPANIKREINDYVREERDSLVNSIRRKARENPLQAAAVGAAVAYPALGLLRAIPTPLLLIGAGLFLTSKRGQQTAKDIGAKVDNAWQDGAEKVSEMAGSITSDLEDRVAGVRYGAEEARGSVSSAADTTTAKVRAAFDDSKNAVQDVARNASERTTATIRNVAASMSDGADTVTNRAAAMGTSTRNSVVDFVNANPLLVAGIGVAVGAFVAASIPESEAENRMFGVGSEKLKDQARDAAARGIQKVSDIAAETAGSVAAASAREGLDAAGVTRALNTVADSVRSVAERGLDTAMGAKAEPTQQPTTERNLT